jgi:hypothetical protein
VAVGSVAVGSVAGWFGGVCGLMGIRPLGAEVSLAVT